MPAQKILISGAGIAGSTTAYFLALAGFSVTVFERNPSLRILGQGVDMEGPAISIIQKMNLENTIRAKSTGEKGVAFVDEKNVTFATFDVGDRRSDIGEILRTGVGSSDTDEERNRFYV
jgi:2-polyprenyl-6-methoxyphenol hydroxylase-like FAD-dependent oxidoreductase